MYVDGPLINFKIIFNRYSTAKSLDGYPFVGYLDVYGGGGYVLPLTGKTSDLRRQFGELENLKWIDKYSRAVLVEFSVYNTQVHKTYEYHQKIFEL